MDIYQALEDLADRLADMDRARGTDPTGRSHWEGYDRAAHECGAELTAILARFSGWEAGK